MKRVLIALVLSAIPLGSAPIVIEARVMFSFPRIVMFYGGLLKDQRVYLTNPDDLITLISDTSPWASSVRPTVDAPSLEVALYWNNPLWEPYVADPTRLATLPLPAAPYPEPPAPGNRNPQASVAPARFYLATA